MPEAAELLVEVTDSIAVVTLNRPKAFNALTLGMVREFSGYLRQWAVDPAIRAVVVQGAGDKAFCAGGDIRQLYDARAHGSVPTDFFFEEYRMNSLIQHFPKPYIALLDGVTMGGGVGISAHGRYRIATERTLWAMPETAIGLFPDVGGSYILPRLPGRLGLYLGLTGTRLRAADLIDTGLATHYVPSDHLEALKATLLTGEAVEKAVARFTREVGAPVWPEVRESVDRLFSADRIEEIMAGLVADGSEWARETEAVLARMSPTSLKLTLAANLRSAGLTFNEVMQMEFRIVSRLMQGEDFFEGVRAMLIDRDHTPKWQALPAEAVIEAYFAPLSSELSF